MSFRSSPRLVLRVKSGAFVPRAMAMVFLLLGLVASWRAVGASGIAEGGFAGEFHAAFVIDSDALDLDEVAHFDGIVDPFNPTFSQFRDMNETVAAWEDFDKDAEILEGDDATFVSFSDFNIPGEARDKFFGADHCWAGVGVDTHRAIVLDVDFSTRFGADALDGFATRSDEESDFVLGNLKGFDLRGVGGKFVTMRRDDGGHKLKNFVTGGSGTIDRIVEERKR